ncbi:hypothetical protein ABPG77_005201 [Micractinium sp. CCAP 211/92]
MRLMPRRRFEAWLGSRNHRAVSRTSVLLGTLPRSPFQSLTADPILEKSLGSMHGELRCKRAAFLLSVSSFLLGAAFVACAMLAAGPLCRAVQFIEGLENGPQQRPRNIRRALIERPPGGVVGSPLGALSAGAAALRSGSLLPASLPPPALPGPDLHVPWTPMLTEQDVARGLAYWGSGRRLQAVAAKLLAGKPIKVVTLGGAVAQGRGTSDAAATSYPSRLFQFINASFPHGGHVFVNRGRAGASSGALAACLARDVPGDADLITLDFTLGEHADEAPGERQWRESEQLLRGLLQLPSRPAVVQLNYYAWWLSRAAGKQQGVFYQPPAEAQLVVLSQYYDIPTVSLRAATHQLMQAGVPGFKVDKVLRRKSKSLGGKSIPVAAAKERDDYFYADGAHPSDRGHQALAELLSSLLIRAVGDERAADSGSESRPERWAEREAHPALRAIRRMPPPMIPGNAAPLDSACGAATDPGSEE